MYVCIYVDNTPTHTHTYTHTHTHTRNTHIPHTPSARPLARLHRPPARTHNHDRAQADDTPERVWQLRMMQGLQGLQ